MLRFLLLFLLTGCSYKYNPQPSDTKFKENQRNWEEVFIYEIKTAIENEDPEAYYFFMQELIKEKYYKEHGVRIQPNPPLDFFRENPWQITSPMLL